VREERLADLLGAVIQPIQISDDIANDIVTALRATDEDAERRRASSATRTAPQDGRGQARSRLRRLRLGPDL
jgi:hypothetical protein